jgi:radical SAM protein with 4Fe4S-binding SPASM domain
MGMQTYISNNRALTKVKKYLPYLTPLKLSNAFLAFMSYNLSRLLKRGVILNNPVNALVEPTNYCNLKCPLCPTGAGILKRKKGYMEWKTYTTFIDDVGKYLLAISFWNYGEPFLHKNLAQMVKYAHDRGIYTIISTNGHFFSDERIAEILDSGLSKIILSVDGASQKTLEVFRKGARIDEIINGASKLIIKRNQRGMKTPILQFQFIVMKHNEHEIETAKQLAEQIGCDEFRLKLVSVTKKEREAFMPNLEEYQGYTGAGDLKKELGFVCRRPWEHTVVNWDGEVSACCHDPEISIQLGDLKKEPFGKIWRGRNYSRLRQQIASSRNMPPICQKCEYR